MGRLYWPVVPTWEECATSIGTTQQPAKKDPTSTSLKIGSLTCQRQTLHVTLPFVCCIRFIDSYLASQLLLLHRNPNPG